MSRGDRIKTIWVIVSLGVSVFLFFSSQNICAQARVGEKAPGFITSTLTGQRIGLKEYWEKQEKKAIVLSFFATWCQPCKEDVKYLQQVQDRHGSQGLQVLGVLTQDSAKESEVRVFLQNLGVNLPVLMDQDGIIGKRYGLIGLPCNFIIDKEGILRGKYLGYSEDVKREFIKCLTALGQMDIAKLISGRVGKIGNRYSVSLNLFDTQNAKAENAVSEFGRSEDELIDLVRVALWKLLGAEVSPAKIEQRPLPSTASEIGRDGRFIAYSNGTVIDTRTGLIWAAKDNGENINWANVKSYCENYREGGYSDWRMPTQDELAGLYDSNKSYKATQRNSYVRLTELIQLSACCPWASETRGSEAAYFVFELGLRSWIDQSIDFYTRALPVRSGK